ncbi:MAG: SusC/RagA family TonB-linked outer membrane protein [Marinifilaceae bacterium]|nr:SusC/RagA family TonB-linked outer membrane protein [Marinifilaceae bacterium]
MFNANAESFSQKKKVSLDFKDTKLEYILKEIRKQTEWDFFYSRNYLDVDKKFTVSSKNESVEKLLNDLLGDSYQIDFEKGLIIITKAKQKAPKEEKKIKGITGVVKDSKGESLPGVSVVVKGTQIGVSTDINGQFNIVVDKKLDVTLVVSFVGMKTQEVKLGKKQSCTVILQEATEELEGIVVTGYQRIEKRKLTSAITSVKGKDVIEPVANSIDQMLQGKIAGMAVMNQTSTPGAAPKIRIRGSSSITGNREPVWVVDGVVLRDPVPISTEELNSMDKVNLIGNAISSINPQDIERIDVLKDASATAIYGTKAANGVIVITTKRGKKGPMRINYNSSYSITSRPKYDGMMRMNSAERIAVSEEMRERGLAYDTQRPSNVAYEGALKELWNKDISLSEFDDKVNELRNNNTDWFDLLFRNSFSTNQTVSISGADDKTSYYASVGFSNSNGATRGVNLKKYNATINLSSKFSEKLSIDLGLRGSVAKDKRNHSSIAMMNYAYNTSRAIPAYNPDGTKYFYAEDLAYHLGEANDDVPDLGYNIFNELENTGSSNNTNSLGLQASLNYKINTYLKYTGMVSYNVSSNDRDDWADERSYYITKDRKMPFGMPIPKEDDTYKQQAKLPYGGEMKTDNTNNTSYTARSTITFNKYFAEKHSVTTNLGFEIQSSKYKGVSSTQFGYLPLRGRKVVNVNPADWPAFAQNIADNPNVYTNNRENLMSYYGTFSYGYDSRYIFNFNIRGDGSNKFGQDKSTRFVPIWSVSTRWNLDRENFLKDSKIISSLSVIASYGTQGNVPEDNPPYLVVQLGTLDATADQYESRLLNFPNKFLRWERTNSYNLGMDFSLFNGAVSGGLQLYKKLGKDQIVTRSISSTNGAASVAINGGDIENKGWELSLSTTAIKTKDFSLGFSFNSSKNYNKITNAGLVNDIFYQQYLDGTIIKNGKSVNSFYSYKFDKLDENGFPIFKDINLRDEKGNLVVNTREEAYNRALAFSGKREPDLTGGFTTNLRYKRLTMNFLLSFSLGAKVRLNRLYKDSGQALPYPQQNLSSEFVNRWKQSVNENTVIPVLSDQTMVLSDYLRERNMMHPTDQLDQDLLVGDNLWQMYNYSDLRVVSGDFLRCRSLSLSYSLANNLCKRLKMNSVNLGFTVNNVFTIKDKDLKGRDPEQVDLGSKTIPPQRTYSLSLNVNF